MKKADNKRTLKIRLKCKALLALALVGTMLAAVTVAFVGCAEQEDQEKASSANPPVTQPVAPAGDSSNPGDETPMGESKIPVEIISAYFENLNANNYSYQKTAGTDEILYQLAGENYYYKNTSTATDVYYIVEDGIAYEYNFDATDGKYHKTFAVSTFEMNDNTKSVVYDDLSDAVWTDYDADMQIFSGTLAGEPITFKIEAGNAFLMGNGWSSQLFNVGSTNVNAPASELVVDETKGEEAYIWSEEEGYAYNIPLLAKTVETWIKENDDATRYFIYGNNQMLKIAWIIPSKTNIDFYALTKAETGEITLTSVKARKSLATELVQGTIKTVQDLKNFMDNDGKNFTIGDGDSITFEYTSLDYTAEQKAELETMTENVFNRLGTIGYQEGSIKNEGTPVDLSNATILWAGKTAAGGTSAGGDIGFCREYYIDLLIEQNGKLKFIKTGILSSTDGVKDEKQHVLNNDTYGWFVGIYKEAEIDKKNLSLWQEENA